jgi:flagellar hook protein FlgE
MLRSLFAGISGMRSHQAMMDVTGNNIANVNTAGFKSSQAVFQDTLSQLVHGAGAPQNAAGGTNPAQIGLGVRLGGVTTNFAQGATQTTGRSTDLMIQGDGFFQVSAGGQQYYTRAGSFSFDANGMLVTQDGAVVQGWSANAAGAISASGALTGIQLPINTVLAPAQTAKGTLGGNLPADAALNAVVSSSIQMFDSQGVAHTVKFDFTKSATDTWDVAATDGTTSLGTGTLTFDSLGALASGSSIALTTSTTTTPPWPAASPIAMDAAGMTQYAGTSSAAALTQDGSAMGSLESFTLSPDGTVLGVFSNGLKQAVGQIALTTFSNPSGLEKAGGSMYRATVNSGNPQVGIAGSGGRGQLSSGALEMSNVDLAQEFTNLIVAQRGFQANSRVISASDEILQDLVNLKR